MKEQMNEFNQVCVYYSQSFYKHQRRLRQDRSTQHIFFLLVEK